ncbi:hypothetical protein ACNPNN_20750 [Stenotrophomonas geniculata]|uniref:hypothetical protein n=1 Tax=Stenotrophomonas geniculata TaxID=86188 RepID=UPI003AB01069
MNHISTKLLVGLLALAATSGAMAQAAPSFKINVTGTIAPGSCTPVTGDLTFDMKSINPRSLNNDAVTMLAGITNKVKITCTADTAIALNVTGSTKAPGTYGSNVEDHPAGMSTSAANVFDLVNPADGNKRVGVYLMQFRNFTYTGAAAGAVTAPAAVVKSTDKVTWSHSSSLNAWDSQQLKPDGSNYLSFADMNAKTAPVRASVFEGELVVAPTILAKKQLALTGDLKFEGGAVITLSYL